MKVGDKVPVTLGGHEVASAEITAIEDGKATLRFPATQVVMGVRTELEIPTPVAPAVEHQVIGVEQVGGDTSSAAVDEVNAAKENPVDTVVEQNQTLAPAVAESSEASNAPAVQSVDGSSVVSTDGSGQPGGTDVENNNQ